MRISLHLLLFCSFISVFKNGTVAWVPSNVISKKTTFGKREAFKSYLYKEDYEKEKPSDPPSTVMRSRGRSGNWLPTNLKEMEPFLTAVSKTALVAKEAGDTLIQPIEELKNITSQDRVLAMNVEKMITDANNYSTTTPLGTLPIQDFDHFLHMLNQIVRTSPAFYTTNTAPDPNEANGLIAFPINALLDFPMGTDAGYVVFSNLLINQQLKKILNYWTIYLETEASAYVLEAKENDPLNVLKAPLIPWLSAPAEEQIVEVAFHWNNTCGDPNKGVPHGTKYEDVFLCYPKEENKGYKSWDEFFTRIFRPEVRPVGGPKPKWVNSNRIILNACESAPLANVTRVSLTDKFWLKCQPYSIENILDFDERASQFENGTIYQAFLSGLSYHRWHSPVSGTIVKTKNVAGSYYLENINFGLQNPKPDLSAPNDSQKFLSAVAAKGLIFIEADGPIGLMCFVAVGMSEVSSCDITVEAGQRVEQGDEIGMFHYGGSSHCLLFRDNVNLEFIYEDYNTGHAGKHATNVPVKAQLARVMDNSPALK